MISPPCVRIVSYRIVRHKSSNARGKPTPAPVNAGAAALNAKHATLKARSATVNVKTAITKPMPAPTNAGAALNVKHAILKVKSTTLNVQPATAKIKPTAIAAKSVVVTAKPVLVNTKMTTKTTALNAKPQPTLLPYRPPLPRVTSAPPRTIIEPDEIVNFDAEGRLTVYQVNGRHRIASKSDPGVGLVYAYQPGDTEFFRLKDGRTLCYARRGRRIEKGPILLQFHGTPGSRMTCVLDEYAESQGIRLIVIDRPGYGHSTARYGNNVLDFASDVEELVDGLGISEFMVYGVSGGGPYALACAYHFPPSRLLATGIMCGATGFGWGFAIPQQAVDYYRWRFLPRSWNERNWNRKKKERRDAFLIQLKISEKEGSRLKYAIKEESDQERVKGLRTKLTLWDNEHKEIVRDFVSASENFRQLAAGFNGDHTTMKRGGHTKWGFDLSEIDSNPIHWYHGTMDYNVHYKNVPGLCSHIKMT